MDQQDNREGAIPDRYMKRAEEIYSFMQITAKLIEQSTKERDISVFDDQDYKKLVCGHIATSLRVEHFRGSNKGLREIMEVACGSPLEGL